MPLFLIFDTLEIIEEIMNEKICPKIVKLEIFLYYFRLKKFFCDIIIADNETKEDRYADLSRYDTGRPGHRPAHGGCLLPVQRGRPPGPPGDRGAVLSGCCRE